MKHVQRTRKRGESEPVVLGFDSETMAGPPITLQFHSEALPQWSACEFIGTRAPVDVFLGRLSMLPPGRYRMYGHNLEFDMLSALWDVRADMRDGDIDFEIGDWTIKGRYSKPVFAMFTDGERHIELVDSFLWFMSSLAEAAKRVCPDLPKLNRPAGLGEKLFTAADTDFVEYAMRDAVVATHLGLAIERFHRELEIPPQISLASMAAAVFRLRYMRDNIYQPPLHQWMVGAAAGYHGGVNRIRPGAAPAWHLNVTALDISSAYPYAMSGFPAFNDAGAYKSYRTVRGRPVASVPDLGVYRIAGHAAPCDWPALFNHDFKPLAGAFTDTWVTGFELNTALAAREVKVTAVDGYHYNVRKADRYSPFAAFVAEFYRLKSQAADPVMRFMYKILLNALTGKFIQTSPDWTLVDGKLVKIRRAGGLYHPFIAALITGHTRAAIHQLEHEHQAIHTATDGIFVPGHIRGAKSKTLGAVVSEGHGDLALFRNKLYVFYGSSKRDGFDSQVFKGRSIIKCAKHGFQGKVWQLETMLTSPNRTYRVEKPIKLKTALRTGEAPNKFTRTVRTLQVPAQFKIIDHA